MTGAPRVTGASCNSDSSLVSLGKTSKTVFWFSTFLGLPCKLNEGASGDLSVDVFVCFDEIVV